MKKILIILGSLVLVVAILFAGFVVYVAADQIIPDSLNYVVNPDGETCTVTGLKENVFDAGYRLVIPKKIMGYTVTKIGVKAFEGNNFEEVEFPDTIVSIGAYAFRNCENLRNVIGLENCTELTEIKEETFRGCKELELIILPEGLKTIGPLAFGNCYAALETVNIPSTVTSIKLGAFWNCMSIKEMNIPKSTQYIGDAAFDFCMDLEGISVDPENPYWCSVDGVLYSKDMKTLHTYVSGKRDAEFTIPDGVTTISYRAFSLPMHLKTLVIPSSVTEIGIEAFYDNLIEGQSISTLKSIKYNGTVEMWDKIVKLMNWRSETLDCIIYCTDGQISKDGTVTYN